MGTGIDQRSVRSCSTGGSSRRRQASCCAVPVISMPLDSTVQHSASRGCQDGRVPADPVPPGAARVTAVPHRMRLICAVTAAVVVVGMLLVALFLRHESTGVVSFGGADQFAIAGIGLVLGAGIL